MLYKKMFLSALLILTPVARQPESCERTGHARRRRDGKIRLMYAAQALAFITQQAGGYGSDGLGNVLNIRPHSLHQRVPFFVGNAELVQKAEALIQEYDQDWIARYLAYRNREASFV